MIRIIRRAAAALVLAGSAGSVAAQAINENFDNVAGLTASGWFIQNNSNPLGPNSWYQGIPTTASPSPGPFNAYNGAENAYVAANFASTTGGTGTISNWLGLPNRTFRNGDVFSFFTRKPAIPPGGTDYPDRLEVRLSTNGASTNVGTGASALGDFTTLLLTINPSLVAGGYPYTWTQYTITVSGLPAPTSGRIAFRYYVTNGGPTGSNSDYIGIDAAAYTPYVCPAVTVTGSPGAATMFQDYSANFSQTGALGAPTFSVTAGALPPGLTLSAAGAITGAPTATGTFNFTVTASDASGCSGSLARSITVSKADQLITFGTQGPQTYSLGGTFAIDPPASASSGLEVSYESATLSVCTVAGTTVAIQAAGDCTITADQAGDDAWNAAPQVEQTITIAPAAQLLTFPAQTQTSRWFKTAGATFPIDPLATSALPHSGSPIVYSSLDETVCQVSGTTVTMVAAGTCTIAADQAGDGNYLAAVQATVAVELVVPTQADLSVDKTADIDRARIGDTVAYTIVVGNDGPADALDVRVNDVPPTRLDPASVVWQCVEALGTACPTPDSGLGELDAILASLPEDATVRFELLGTVRFAADPLDDFLPFDNIATVALPQAGLLTDPAGGNNADTATVLVVPLTVFSDGFETPE